MGGDDAADEDDMVTALCFRFHDALEVRRSIGEEYTVDLYRRIPMEMANIGGTWDVFIHQPRVIGL